MKLFFISDLHGCLKSTQQALNAFERSGAEHLILLGDILNHGPRNPVPDNYNPAEVANLLNQYKHCISAVRGNCDSEVDQMLLEFPMLMDSMLVLLESGQKMFLTHGHLYHASRLPLLNPGDILCHGHTHIPQASWHEKQFIFNPGSITFPKNGLKASYGLYQDGVFSVLLLEDDTLYTQGSLLVGDIS